MIPFFPRIYDSPEGLIAWCQGCGNCLEAGSKLSMTAAILDHLRRKHRAEWCKTDINAVARAVIAADRTQLREFVQ